MPNHFHGIIIIRKGDANEGVGAIHELPLRQKKASPIIPTDRHSRRRMLLPKIIGYFKMNTAKHINILRDAKGQNVWQRNYYESIIRNEADLHNIRDYIQSNPLQWEFDEYYRKFKNKSAPWGITQ